MRIANFATKMLNRPALRYVGWWNGFLRNLIFGVKRRHGLGHMTYFQIWGSFRSKIYSKGVGLGHVTHFKILAWMKAGVRESSTCELACPRKVVTTICSEGKWSNSENLLRYGALFDAFWLTDWQKVHFCYIQKSLLFTVI